MKIHYVYKLILPSTGEYYIGSRTCENIDPLLDYYKGSMKKWAVDKAKLVKIIIKDGFKNRSDANKLEAEILKGCINDELNRNYAIREKFHMYGYKYSESEKVEKYIGVNNPMYGKSFYDVWVEKYGVEIADEKLLKHNKKLSDAHIGKKRPDISIMNSGVNNPMYGKKHSDDSRKKISEARTKMKKPKPVTQFDLNGNIIKEWDDISEIAINTTFKSQCVARVCYGYRKTYKKFIWKWKKL